MGAEKARQIYGDGSFGGPYQASEMIMQKIFQAALDDVLQLIKFE
jgi:creatinine amidohydrolase